MPSIAEQDTAIKFGLVSQEVVRQLTSAAGLCRISVKIFRLPEDTQWCEGARQAQTASNHKQPGMAKAVPDMAELTQKLDGARRSGMAPFSFEGPVEEMAGFIQRAGIADVELIP